MNEDEATTPVSAASPTKTAFDHDMSSTLPNPEGGSVSDGSVMCDVPSPLGVGPRSGVTGDVVGASDVTPGIDAKQRDPSGAAVAPATAQRQAKPAVAFVREMRMSVIAGTPVGELSAAEKVYISAPAVLTDSEAFEIVRTARSLLALDKETRRRRMDTVPSANTVADYERKCRRVDDAIDAIQDPWEAPLQMVMAGFAPRKQTYSAMLAALKWRAIHRVRTYLTEQDGLQREGQRGQSWQAIVRLLRTATKDLCAINALNYDECLSLSDKERERSESKKGTLRKLKRGWQERFLKANDSSPTYRASGLLLRFCGVRPVELEKGIRAQLIGKEVSIEVNGGKVRETAGQPWRKFRLHAAMLPDWFLLEVAEEGGKLYSAKPGSLRAHLARISAALFPARDSEGNLDILLSAYVFRHGLVTDMRAEKWGTADIAAVIGESTSATLKWYGLRQHTGSVRASPVAIVRGSIQTARPVRPPNVTGLTKVLNQKATKAKRRRI